MKSFEEKIEQLAELILESKNIVEIISKTCRTVIQ